FIPGTTTLRNLFISEGNPFGEPDPDVLRRVEEHMTRSRMLELVLLQSWAESSEDSVSHSLMAAACGRSQAVSKTRLTITASGFGCPYPNSAPSPPPWRSPPPPCSCRPHPPRSRRWNGLPPRLRQA